MDEEIKYFLLIENRKYVEISHVIGCSHFVISVSYVKKNSGGEIKNLLLKIIKEAKKSDLARYGWKVHRPFVEVRKNLNCYNFIDWFDIIFPVQ